MTIHKAGSKWLGKQQKTISFSYGLGHFSTVRAIAFIFLLGLALTTIFTECLSHRIAAAVMPIPHMICAPSLTSAVPACCILVDSLLMRLTCAFSSYQALTIEDGSKTPAVLTSAYISVSALILIISSCLLFLHLFCFWKVSIYLFIY